ncbi:MAG: NAD-dependent epimerase/dehydratase family protein [Oligosphaeraceae bacterium]
MRILVTGGAGFIGSHLCHALLNRGNEVHVLDDFSTGSLMNLTGIDLQGRGGLCIHPGSVNDAAMVESLVSQADYVYHLASAVGVRLIIDQPVRTIESIVGGTTVVLDACNRHRTPFLLTSTSEVYGKGSRVPFCEEDDTVMGPTCTRRWSYACAKALDEFLTLAYWVENRLPVTVVRLFNTVGPRQTGQYGMVIPTLVEQALRGLPVTVYGDGTQTRCFTHVADIVDALVAIPSHPETRGQVINLGNDQEISILQLAKEILKATGSSSPLEIVPYEKAYGPGFEDMHRRVPSLRKAARLLGYHPRHGLEDILRDVVEEKRRKLSL